MNQFQRSHSNFILQLFNLQLFNIFNSSFSSSFFVLYYSVRGVAQPGSALAWGARGRKFKSCHPDEKKASLLIAACWLFCVYYWMLSEKKPAG